MKSLCARSLLLPLSKKSLLTTLFKHVCLLAFNLTKIQLFLLI